MMITNTLIWAFLPLQVFLLLAIAISYYPQGIWGDQELLLLLHQTANPILDQLAIQVTKLGIYGGTLPIIVLLAGILTYFKKWRSLLYLTVTGLGSITLTYRTKSFFARPRPHLWEGFYTTFSPAFPSGHALSSMILAMILITLTWGTRWQFLSLIAGLIFVVLIAWTRLYLGVHYPSDILGGWSLAIAWSLLIQGIILGLTQNRDTILKNE
ncbi:MAG: phosphatase PAP2 family protein [Microcystaceae cyanobacterium]